MSRSVPLDNLQRVKELINGQLIPHDNIRQVVFKGTTPSVAHTEFTVTHNLNRIVAGSGPNGNEPGLEFICWLTNATGFFYLSDGSDPNSIKFRSGAVNATYTLILR